MGVIDAIKGIYKLSQVIGKSTPKQRSQARGYYPNVHTWSYDGEKNIGEIGPVKDYYPDYDMLRLRSWQSYLESDITQMVIGKFKTWIIGSGLKLQAEPIKMVLESEGVRATDEKFNQLVESRFSVYAKSNMCDYSGMKNLHMLADEAFLNTKLAGDVLVILRYIDNQVKVQLIDGAHVCTPYSQKMVGENKIMHGVELSETGEHLAYHVKTKGYTFQRVAAKSSSGMTTAFLVYGSRYRLDTHRGIPLISVVLESLKKLERYKEATVGSAEERQKIAYTIVHDINSTGENPIQGVLARAMDADGGNLPTDINGVELQNLVAATVNKQAVNMPIGADMKMLESKNELYFKDFFSTNIDLVCAALGIPPNVAMSMYNDSFSASRAATKDWENTINVNRSFFSFQFYQRIYTFWLETEILKNKVQASGYLSARNSNNLMVINAYTNARFTGAMFPHINPQQEAAAERLKLGPAFDHIPLTTIQNATEALSGGDSEENLSQAATELERAKKLGIEPKEPKINPPKKGED